MWKFIWSIYTIFLILPPSVPEKCEIWNYRMEDHFPLPLFEWEDGLVYVNTGVSVLIEIEDGASVNISCTGSYLQYYSVGYKNLDSAVLKCDDGKFTSEEWIPGKELIMLWISCYQPPKVIQKHTETACGEKNKGRMTEVYMESIYQNDHLLFEVCFDESIKQPLYVKHLEQKKFQLFFRNIRIIDSYADSSIFSSVRIQEFYMDEYFQGMFAQALGGIYWDYLRNDTIVHGKLLRTYNFPLDSLQRATYDYINYVPVWDRIEKGNWGQCSVSIRLLTEEPHIVVYSGAWGVLTLKDSNGEQKEILLESKESTRYPIPQWLYQVAYDEKSKKGIAFLILNNSFVTIEEAKEYAKIFSCSDVCPDWYWITHVELQKGYVICCEVDDFRKVIKDLPDFETVGVLP